MSHHITTRYSVLILSSLSWLGTVLYFVTYEMDLTNGVWKWSVCCDDM